MFKTQLAESLGDRLRKLGVPVGVNFWDGSSVTPAAPPRVRLSVRTPRALAALINPSMGKLARHYVEQDLDVEGDARDVVRLSEAISPAPNGQRRPAHAPTQPPLAALRQRGGAAPL